MQKYCIQTYGCQMNYSDTERMETYLKALGYKKTNSFKDADLIIFNTCSIRQKAEDRVTGQMKKIRELRKKKSDLIITITGCMVRNSSSRYSPKRDKLFSTLSELDIALRIEEMYKFAELVRELNPECEIEKIEEEEIENYFQIKASHAGHPTKTQAFVPISTGCDKFCTYCIVPFSRGREKSRGMEEIFEECKQLVEDGCKEITLIGQTVNSYGLSIKDKSSKKFNNLEEGEEPFVHLLKKINTLKKHGLSRLRFTSPHPKDMSDQLIEAIANLETLMPYIHLPVQSGDNKTLKRMNRPYTVERFKEIIEKLRKKIPGIAITTDLIVGFCGETEEEFENTRKFFEEMNFDHAFIAQFSERRGTFAEKYLEDNIPQEEKNRRWHIINNILKESSRNRLQKSIGKKVMVLVETKEKNTYTGRDEHFKTVQFTVAVSSRADKKSGKNLIGEIVPVKITSKAQWVLIGELL